MPTPDYHKQVGEVYREFTIARMRAEKALNILYEVPSDSREMIDGLVSWAPDFSSSDSVSGRLGARGGLRGDDNNLRLKALSATGKSSGRFGSGDNSSRLHLYVKLVDTITYCGARLYWREAWLKGFSEILVTMLGIMNVLGSWARASTHCTAYSAPAKNEQAFYDTLTEGFRRTLPRTQLNPEAFEEEERQAFASWYDSVTALPESTDFFPKPWDTLPDDADIDKLGEEAMSRAAFTPETMNLFAGLRKDLGHRKDFFTTEAGYMGTVQGLVKEGKEVSLVRQGDRIALVEGMNLPMVLRPVVEEQTGECFQLVTHAYVHGIMYGEAWNDPKYVLQKIQLV